MSLPRCPPLLACSLCATLHVTVEIAIQEQEPQLPDALMPLISVAVLCC